MQKKPDLEEKVKYFSPNICMYYLLFGCSIWYDREEEEEGGRDKGS